MTPSFVFAGQHQIFFLTFSPLNVQSFPPSFTVLKLSQVENRRAVAMVTNKKFLNFESIFFLYICIFKAKLLGPCSGAALVAALLEQSCRPTEHRENETSRDWNTEKRKRHPKRYWVVESLDIEIETSSDWKIGKVETMREWDIEILSQREKKWLRESVSDKSGNLENNVGAYFFQWRQKTINICEVETIQTNRGGRAFSGLWSFWTVSWKTQLSIFNRYALCCLEL